MRILVADDDPITLRMLESAAKRWEYEVILAHDGTQAWQLLHQPPVPAMALLDWMMPGMSGLEICKKIRQGPDTEFIYTILLTANNLPEDISAGLDAGAHDYIVKPFDKEELRSRLAAGARVVKYEESLKRMNEALLRYSQEMESLAQKRAEQLVQADRMVFMGTMAAGIAHEIKNPLTIIQGNLTLFKRFWGAVGRTLHQAYYQNLKTPTPADPTPDMLQDILETAFNALQRIRKIVDGMRSFAHGRGGQVDWLTALQCAKDAIQICLPKTKHVGEVKIIAEEIPFQVKGNAVQITQVLVNLIANAADALAGTEHPELTVTIQARNRHLQFVVRDNGPGISPENLSQLWSPFFTTKPVGEGSGLGLPICQTIIEDHGGQIQVESVLGAGTAFTVDLPNAEEYERFAASKPPETPGPTDCRGGTHDF